MFEFVTVKDGARIFYKDWGAGMPARRTADVHARRSVQRRPAGLGQALTRPGWPEAVLQVDRH
ncbi:hypothetical protein [Pseudoxanthomonas sp. X-1]|uniref:hypothetical protein n=1 Tax=Pseudoxanthomonas sp. X-1 TaxID=2571115 RepID=UPI00110B50D2|nr:hypothetical protein [Pseudoxanthomonas sp. X-1]TMN24448.1 hypothetical protein FF950_04985 [Pseudoxanthomonas sp. X-1]UAY75285.1 hypothetical protein LAJ50_03240 [Pseudoxanthomonas sp. X-1]